MYYSGFNIGLPALCVAWGLVCTFQGFVDSYGGLIAAREWICHITGQLCSLPIQSLTPPSSVVERQDSSSVHVKVLFYQYVWLPQRDRGSLC